MSNRSAVFGGAGFIGTNLVYQLIEDGQQVFNFDNLSGLGNLLNIAELMQQSRHSSRFQYQNDKAEALSPRQI